MGCFPPGGAARIIWVSVGEPPQTLLDCQQACEQGYAELGFKKEKRKYSPHLTIGRVRDFGASGRIRAAVENESNFKTGSFVADELVLFQSVLKPSGPVHTVISRTSLASGEV